MSESVVYNSTTHLHATGLYFDFPLRHVLRVQRFTAVSANITLGIIPEHVKLTAGGNVRLCKAWSHLNKYQHRHQILIWKNEVEAREATSRPEANDIASTCKQ